MAPFTTDKADITRFRPHGRVEFDKLSDNILCYVAYGPFNEELIDALANVEPQLLFDFREQPRRWGDVVVFRESAVAAPETVTKFAAYLQHKAKIGMTATATAMVLPPEVEGACMMKPIYQRVYSEAGIDYRCFDTEDEAKAWIITAMAAHTQHAQAVD